MDVETPNKTSARQAVIDYFTAHPVLIPTLATFLASSVGYAVERSLLNAFGFAIADYADVDDFLLAGMKRPGYSGTSIVLFLLVLIAVAWSFKEQRNKGGSGLRAVVSMVLLLFPVFTIMAPFAASNEAAIIRDAQSHNVVVTLRNGDTIPADGETDKLSLITGTNSFLFFSQICGLKRSRPSYSRRKYSIARQTRRFCRPA